MQFDFLDPPLILPLQFCQWSPSASVPMPSTPVPVPPTCYPI